MGYDKAILENLRCSCQTAPFIFFIYNQKNTNVTLLTKVRVQGTKMYFETLICHCAEAILIFLAIKNNIDIARGVYVIFSDLYTCTCTCMQCYLPF